MVRNASLEAQSNTSLLLSRLILSRESGYHGYQSARESEGVAPKEPLERYYTDRLAIGPEERESRFAMCKACLLISYNTLAAGKGNPAYIRFPNNL